MAISNIGVVGLFTEINVQTGLCNTFVAKKTSYPLSDREL